ncbi:MAG TPA: glycosyltransferase family 39 protein, partial [Candidatus Acidoferrales bacterium]|nr:glycosyltransferase family 39 protein [Candidatus Acidoferrales bacterium]
MFKELRSPGEFRSIFLIVLLAFALRVAIIPFLLGGITTPARNHWTFGWEEGRIARSLASGEGFGSPLFGNTGPTAWTNPVYPYLLAGVFEVFGIYTKGAAWAMLIVNSLFSALTCIPVYFIGKRCFDKASAIWAAGIWAVFPYAIYFASGYVWGFCLDALVLALVVWCTLAMAEETRPIRWAGYGLLWGAAALINAVLLSTLPFLLAWLVWRRVRSGTRRRLNSTIAMFCLALVVFPWFVRNYNTFARVIPFRSTFWLTFWEANTGDTSTLYPDWTNPAHNTAEMEEYRRLGELGYVHEKKLASLNFVTRHPGLYLLLSTKRFVFTWTGFWSLKKDYRVAEPFAVANIVFCTALTVLLMIGAWRAVHINRDGVLPLLFVLASYPLVYYLAHSGAEYRHPIDPICVVFIGYLAASMIPGRVRARLDADKHEP